MDSRSNPYAPGAGTPPPELAGRDDLIEEADISLDRLKAGFSTRGLVYTGLCGVGKTVLLNHVRRLAESKNIAAVRIEASEHRSLPAILAPPLRTELLRTLSPERPALAAALGTLSAFVEAMRVKCPDLEMETKIQPTKGLADSGDLDADLTGLIESVGEAAKDNKTGVVFLIDELQFLEGSAFGSLIRALHRANQNEHPVTMFAAGLPSLLGQAGEARAYAERIFRFVELGPLATDAAKAALQKPAREHGAEFSEQALTEVMTQTKGYPYFLQVWGEHCWNLARSSPVTEECVALATIDALAELDSGFFRIRYNRTSPSERDYLCAMADLGKGPYASRDVAEKMNRTVSSVASTRGKLIIKGVIYAPSHGASCFTVPLFDEFLKRVHDPLTA